MVIMGLAEKIDDLSLVNLDWPMYDNMRMKDAVLSLCKRFGCFLRNWLNVINQIRLYCCLQCFILGPEIRNGTKNDKRLISRYAESESRVSTQLHFKFERRKHGASDYSVTNIQTCSYLLNINRMGPQISIQCRPTRPWTWCRSKPPSE